MSSWPEWRPSDSATGALAQASGMIFAYRRVPLAYARVVRSAEYVRVDVVVEDSGTRSDSSKSPISESPNAAQADARSQVFTGSVRPNRTIVQRSLEWVESSTSATCPM